MDDLVAICYAPIHASYAAVRHDPELTWQERKQRQVRRLHAAHPENVWVLADDVGDGFGLVR